MDQDSWKTFIESKAQLKESNPVLFSLINQLLPVEMSGSELTLGCENKGVLIYLQKQEKVDFIEQEISAHLKQRVQVKLVHKERKSKKVKRADPLLTYQPNAQDKMVRAGLASKHTFDAFAVSGSNQVAYAAAQAVAQTPGHAYNPLFLYGGVGVGKTHLAQAIAREVIEQNQNARVQFSPGDQFTNELIESIREKATSRFRKKFRTLNLLIIDDVQFIAGKNTVQEEFFHTFNAIVSSGGQVILTSDRAPSEIEKLEDRLRSRFLGGLIVDVQSPDFELRTAILLIKARQKNIEVDIEMAKIIAQQVEDSRALEGTLLSIYTRAYSAKSPITFEIVESFFNTPTLPNPRFEKRLSHHDVIKSVCSYFELRPSQIKSSSRAEHVALPRQVIMYLLRHELGMKHQEIAGLLKRRDHTTVMHGVQKVERLLVKNPLFSKDVDRITQALHPST